MLDAYRKLLTREKRESSTKAGPENSVRSKDGRSKDNIGIDKVVHNGKEDQDHAKTKRYTSSDRSHPIDRGIIRPLKSQKLVLGRLVVSTLR